MYKIEIEIYEGKCGKLEKDEQGIIFSEGVTTEFIHCVDPTKLGIVVKVIRTKLADHP